jgi:hypothetical protein
MQAVSHRRVDEGHPLHVSPLDTLFTNWRRLPGAAPFRAAIAAAAGSNLE